MIPRDKLIELGLEDIADDVCRDAIPAGAAVKEG
jgi:hypothetical protein